MREISNPGSALGEAIGIVIEDALNETLEPIAKANDCVYVTVGPKNIETKLDTKLLLTDSNGVEYNIDAVIANRKFQPLILIESKYIRYKKHNRDKGSWVCTAHQSLRRRFSSIRSSVAVLAGSWSKTSKAMMQSCDITLFEIPFDTICDVLKKFGIDFRWDEKDRRKAYDAWNAFASLTEEQRSSIGKMLIDLIQKDLTKIVSRVLDNTSPRNIRNVEIQVSTNLGETRVFIFDTTEQALKFLQEFDERKILSTENSPSLFENAEFEVRPIEESDEEEAEEE